MNYFAPDMTPEPDFRLGMVYAMKSRLGYEGSIVVYNAPEVRMMLEAMADAFPAQSDYIYSMLERMVDLCIPFKNFWYYTPAMQGSAALEAVLQALLPHYAHNAADLPEATYRHLLYTLAVHRYALLEEADLNAMAAQAKRYLLGGVGLYGKLVE